MSRVCGCALHRGLKRQLWRCEFFGSEVSSGSLWRALHSDPYAQVETMRSGRLDETCFSYRERRQGAATSSHSFRYHALSARRSPGRERQRRVTPNFVVVRVLARVDQAAARRNAGAFAPDPTGRFGRSLCRITKLRASPPTAACNSGPGTTENYVEARAATPLSRPHRSLLCTVLQLPSAHSWDLRIGGVELNR